MTERQPIDLDSDQAAVRTSQERVTEAMIAHLGNAQGAASTAELREALNRLHHDLARLYNDASVQASTWVFQKDARPVPALQAAVAELQHIVDGMHTVLKHIEDQQRRSTNRHDRQEAQLAALAHAMSDIRTLLELDEPRHGAPTG